MQIDVIYPDVPQRELTGAHRLQNLPELARDISAMLEFVHPELKLSASQIAVLPMALNSLLFGEQA